MRFYTTRCYTHSPFLDKAIKLCLTRVSVKSLLNIDFLLQQDFQDHQINFYCTIQLIVPFFKVSQVLRWLDYLKLVSLHEVSHDSMLCAFSLSRQGYKAMSHKGVCEISYKNLILYIFRVPQVLCRLQKLQYT